MRVSYNGYYSSFPNWRHGFDSRYPLMDDLNKIVPLSSRRLVALVTFSFLLTFVAARLVVYLVLGHLMPDFFLTVKGVHIHHFIYGVVILVVIGFYLLIKQPKSDSHQLRWSALIYGFGLGLTFDEFGMWVMLRDDYWVRQSYDAIIIITLFFLNILLFPTLKGLLAGEISWFWKKGEKVLKKSIDIK